MGKLNSKVTGYIAKAENFAKPILKYWREIIHANCPEVEEAIKWGIPHFEYKDDNICVMASYKNHCSFSFLKADLIEDIRLKDNSKLKPVQRFLGKVTKLSDLPVDKDFKALMKKAMLLNEKGIKIVTPKSDKPKLLEVPDYFTEQLAKHKKAKEIFDSKSASFRKEYIIWITGAKTEATRKERMEQSLEWIADGKGRFWKYAK
jgi:uncharacterized protein YdeI (YjbR/CyaY-like superfamily)